MDISAINKAKDRLVSAKARLKDLGSAEDYDTARRQWYEFLLSSNSVFSVLEQGSKSSNKSGAWMREKKQERKKDSLLSYLQHARNADEHNVPSVTELDRQKIVMMAGDKEVAEIRDMIGNQGTFQSLSEVGVSPKLETVTELRIYPERAKLIRVRDRGTYYDPPEEHLGSTLSDNSPALIATLMVRYIEALITEAESLVVER